MIGAASAFNTAVDWHALAPELALTGGACAVLVLDLLVAPSRKWLAAAITGAALVVAFALLFTFGGEARYTFGRAFQVNDFALVFQGLLAVVGLGVVAVSADYFRDENRVQGEYYFLLLCAVLGGFLIAGARDLITLFISIELVTVPGFIMTALRKRDVKSNEGALKLFVFGVLSSAVMLYGMSLLYGATGATQLDAIARLLPGADRSLVVLSVFFVVVGLAFKISAAPFHFWAPDAFEGAPAPVAAFLATISKLGGFIGLFVVLFRAFIDVADVWRPFIAVLAIASMTVGNLLALHQRNIMRLLAYSGIAQSGYVLVAMALVRPSNPGGVVVIGRPLEVIAPGGTPLSSAIVYLVIFSVMEIGAFAVAIGFARRGGTYFLSDYAGLGKRSPMIAVLMAAFLISLAGAPPLAGLWAKLFVFVAALEARSYILAIIMAINTVIAAWYYLAVVKRMFFDEPESAEPIATSGPIRVATAVAAIVLVALFIYPPLVTHFAEPASRLVLLSR